MARGRRTREDEPGGRERLLAAGARLFARKGYAGTSVRDLLRAAGVTAPVLYYHFGSKEGLFLAIVQEARGRFGMALEKALECTGSSGERVRAYCHALAGVRRELSDLVWVVDGILMGPPDEAPNLDTERMSEVVVETLAGMLSEGMRAGELRPAEPEDVARALMGAVEITARRRQRPVAPAVLDAQLDGMITVILGGLEPTG